MIVDVGRLSDADVLKLHAKRVGWSKNQRCLTTRHLRRAKLWQVVFECVRKSILVFAATKGVVGGCCG